MLTVIRKRVYKSGFQKQGSNLEHLLNDEIKTKSGVVRTPGGEIVFSARGPSHGPCRKIAPGLSAIRKQSRNGLWEMAQERLSEKVHKLLPGAWPTHRF